MNSDIPTILYFLNKFQTIVGQTSRTDHTVSTNIYANDISFFYVVFLYPPTSPMISTILSLAMAKFSDTMKFATYPLTHWSRGTHICVSKLSILGSDNGRLVAWSAPSHYLNQYWDIVNLTLGNKLQWNLNRNEYIFIQENAFENVVWKLAAICLGLNVLIVVK